MTAEEWAKLQDAINCFRNNGVIKGHFDFGDWSVDFDGDDEGFTLEVTRPRNGG